MSLENELCCAASIVEGPSHGVGAALLVELLGHWAAFGLVVEQAGVKVSDRAHFEFGGDEAFDQGVLGLVEGLEAVAEMVEELEEFVGIAVGREELAGGHAVHEAVAAGYGFAFGGTRAGAFLGILAIGVSLRFGSHGNGSLCVMAGVDLDEQYGIGHPACRFYCGVGGLGIVDTKAASD